MPAAYFRPTWSANHAGHDGGDICAEANVSIALQGAWFANSSATSGGSVYLKDSSSATFVNSSITAAHATDVGGGITAADSASVRLTRSSVSQCSSSGHGGGVSLKDAARLVVDSSNITHNVAGSSNIEDEGADSRGGGVYADDTANVVLGNVWFTNNSAKWGGGLILDGKASLLVRSKVHLQKNNASEAGGGVRFNSSGFDPSNVAQLVHAHDNTARESRFQWPPPPWVNLSYRMRAVQVVDRTDVDRVVSSSAFRRRRQERPDDASYQVDNDDIYTVTLNVSGPNGVPSFDPLIITPYAEDGQPLYNPEMDEANPVVDGPVNGTFRKVFLSLDRYPAGMVALEIEYGSAMATVRTFWYASCLVVEPAAFKAPCTLHHCTTPALTTTHNFQANCFATVAINLTRVFWCCRYTLFADWREGSDCQACSPGPCLLFDWVYQNKPVITECSRQRICTNTDVLQVPSRSVFIQSYRPGLSALPCPP